MIDGTVIDEPALHPVGIIATNAEASIASSQSEAYKDYARRCVELFWNTPLRTGIRRYYDNCLYMFGHAGAFRPLPYLVAEIAVSQE